MVHTKKPDAALYRLKKTNRLNSDPWIQAAEIAISEIAGVASASAKKASKLIDDDRINPIHISELASSLASLEYSHGNSKKFRKRLNASMIWPTDNALSQLIWFQNNHSISLPDEAPVTGGWDSFLKKSSEASAYHSIHLQNWDATTTSIEKWQEEEPFSGRAAVLGSFYAVSLSLEYEKAISMCQIGLLANRNDPSLHNNLSVAQSRAGLIAESELSLLRMKESCPNWKDEPAYMATNGMVSFSQGKTLQARNSYLTALMSANSKKDDDLCERVKMHWLFEERRNGLIDDKKFQDLAVKLENSELFKSSDELNHDAWKNMKLELRDIQQQSSLFESQSIDQSIDIASYI